MRDGIVAPGWEGGGLGTGSSKGGIVAPGWVGGGEGGGGREQ